MSDSCDSTINWDINASAIDTEGSNSTLKLTGAGQSEYTESLNLFGGNLYRLKFRAKADTATSIYARVSDFDENGAALNTPMSLYNKADLTDSWVEYEYRFVANTSGNADYIYSKLEFIGTSGNVWIDELELRNFGTASATLIQNGDFENFNEDQFPYQFAPWKFYNTVEQ